MFWCRLRMTYIPSEERECHRMRRTDRRERRERSDGRGRSKSNSSRVRRSKIPKCIGIRDCVRLKRTNTLPLQFLFLFLSQIDRWGINKSPSQIALTAEKCPLLATSIFFLFSFDLLVSFPLGEIEDQSISSSLA